MTMKLSFKCYLAFVLALCLLIPLCSCGQTKTTEAKATETPSTETPTTETPTGTPVTPTPETETPTPETPIPPNPGDDPDIDPILSSDIKRAYARTVPNSLAPEKLSVELYIGTFSGCAAVMIISGGTGDGSSGAEVAGYALLFGNTLQPWLYKDGTIASFGDAYDSGMITRRDVFEISCRTCSQITDHEPIPVNERDAARIPQDVASEMKYVYFWKLSDEGSLGKITAPEQLYVEKFYERLIETNYPTRVGYSYVVRMGDGKEYPDAPRTVKVGGYEIVFPNEQEVWVYNNGIFYTFVEAYDAELIDGHAIANICRRAGFKITEIQ